MEKFQEAEHLDETYWASLAEQNFHLYWTLPAQRQDYLSYEILQQLKVPTVGSNMLSAADALQKETPYWPTIISNMLMNFVAPLMNCNRENNQTNLVKEAYDVIFQVLL
jgi:hypothetical protein